MLARDLHFIALALPDRNVHTAIPDIVDLGSGFYVTRQLPGTLPEHWRDTMGASLFDAAPNAGLFLVVTTESEAGALDVKPGHLRRRLFRFQIGLQIAVPYLSYGEPLLLSGNTENRDVPRYNSYTTYSRTWHTAAHPLTEITMGRLKQARAFSEAIESHTIRKSWSRERPVLSAFRRAAESSYLDERLHDFVRTAEGFLDPGQGAGSKHFAHRAQEITAEECQGDYKEVYEVRSAVTHMRGVLSRIPGPTESERVRRLIFRTIQAETLARYCLATFLSREELWPHFASDDSVAEYWKLPELKRRKLWGSKLQLGGVSKGFAERYRAANVPSEEGD